MAHQPQQLVATAISTTEITLSWDDVATLEGETYDIERDSVVIEEGWASGTTFTDTGLDPDTEYTYRVRASGGSEASGVSLSTVVTASVVLTPTVETETAPFSPSDIAGMVAWYSFGDVDSLWQDTSRTTAITADGQSIQGVTDQSGNGYHLSGTNGPTYKTSIRNSRSIARFDGVDDVLDASTLIARPTATYFVVVKGHVPVGGKGVMGFVNDNAAGLGTNSGVHATNLLYRRDEAASQVDLGADAASWHLVSLNVISASSLVIRVEGGTAAASFNPNDNITTATGMRLGVDPAYALGDSDIAEIVIYDSSLSSADLNSVGGYLATRWGFSWTDV